MTFAEARAAFPVFERLAYLNAGTMGPLSRATTEAMVAEHKRDLEGGRGGLPYFERFLALRDRTRAAVAALIGVAPASVALTSSTTDGCNIVVAGLDLGPEDEIVTTDVEHFGLLGALHVSGARVRVTPVGEAGPAEAEEAVLAAVTERTRLIAVSHIAWTSGNSLAADRLKERTGLPVLVDGAQSVGAIEVDAAPFDFYTVSCQKWLCGPDATGALYVREPERLRVALPTYFSQESHDPDGAFRPWPGAARFDFGWIPPASLAGLLAALESAPEWRFERGAQMAESCRTALAERYEVVTAPGQSGLVSFRPAGDAAEAAARLYEHGVVVRDIPGTGLVRVSCGYWTSDEDIERLLAAL